MTQGTTFSSTSKGKDSFHTELFLCPCRSGLTDKASTSITVDWQLPDSPSRIFLFDGGYNGFKLGSNLVMHLTYVFTYIILTMRILQFMKISGFADAYYSFEAVTWTKMNYEEDGVRASTMPYYSSQGWVSPTFCTFSDRTKTFPQEYFGHKGRRTQIVFVINFTLFLLVTYYLRMMKLFI